MIVFESNSHLDRDEKWMYDDHKIPMEKYRKCYIVMYLVKNKGF